MENRVGLLVYELLLTSSDSDDDYDEGYRGVQILRPRIGRFVRIVVDCYSDEEFRQNFRMYRSTFDHIFNLIQNGLVASNEHGAGRHPVDPKTQLLFTIWYFATPDCYRSICSQYNIGKATAIRTVRRVTHVLLNISETIIQWPSGAYLEDIKNTFNRIGFPNTIGALDGSYIPIPMPKENGLSYICRKNFTALILQAVCDHRMLFTHCYVGEVGSTHDANVLRRSELFSYLTSRRLVKFPNDTHLVADKAYPCLQTLLVPYKDNGHLTEEQRNFNFKLSRVRSIIERSLALLKKRFRCLLFFDIKDIEWACKYIMACCILHNICILQNDMINMDEIVEDDEPAEQAQDFDRELLQLGSVKRNNICELLNQ